MLFRRVLLCNRLQQSLRETVTGSPSNGSSENLGYERKECIVKTSKNLMKCGRKCTERKLLKTMFVDKLKDRREERRPWLIGTKAVKELEIDCGLCSLAVVNVSHSHADVCAEPVGSYCHEGLLDREKFQKLRCSTEHGEGKLISSFIRLASTVDLELF